MFLLGTLIQVPALLAGGEELAGGASPSAVLAESAGLGFLSEVTDLLLATAIFAGIIGFFNYGSRVLGSVAGEGLLPHAFMKVNKRYKSPTVAIVSLAAASIAVPVLLQIVSDATPLEIASYAAALVVYAWVVPYVMVCVGAAILLTRSERVSPLIPLGAVLASAVVVWMYVNGIINPGPAPLDAMPYVWAVTFVVFLIGFVAATARRAAARDA
jgi:amino acid transporter